MYSGPPRQEQFFKHVFETENQQLWKLKIKLKEEMQIWYIFKKNVNSRLLMIKFCKKYVKKRSQYYKTAHLISYFYST